MTPFDQQLGDGHQFGYEPDSSAGPAVRPPLIARTSVSQLLPDYSKLKLADVTSNFGGMGYENALAFSNDDKEVDYLLKWWQGRCLHD